MKGPIYGYYKENQAFCCVCMCVVFVMVTYELFAVESTPLTFLFGVFGTMIYFRPPTIAIVCGCLLLFSPGLIRAVVTVGVVGASGVVNGDATIGCVVVGLSSFCFGTALTVAKRLFSVVGTGVICLVASFGRVTFGVINASVRLLLAGG